MEGENYDDIIDGKNIPLSTKKKVVALKCDTFRDDVRAEWICAVFGTDFPQRTPVGKATAIALTAATTTDPNRTVMYKNNSWKGVGLAGISPYVAYTADLELSRTSASSSYIPPRPETLPSIENSTVMAVNSHCNNDSGANRAIHTTTSTNEIDKKTKNENVPPTSLLLTESQQPSLGMTLSRLSLGLYVRTVRPGSEAWCAGVEDNSVLVGINDGELNLLAEPSKLALERIWQYEGYCCASIDNAVAKDKASEEKNSASNSGTSTANTKMKIRDPISMTFIRAGKLYKVLFLSDPPYGIDWGPCGKFCLIQRVKTGGIADRAGVRPSSIVARIYTKGNGEKSNEIKDEDRNHCNGKNTIYHLDHSSVATTLKEVQNEHNRNTIRIQLCFPPSEARSGHWERQQDNLEENGSSRGKSCSNINTTNCNNTTTRLPQQHLPRPRIAAELDGVQVRIHSLLGGRGNMVSTGRRGDSSSRRSRSEDTHRNNQRSSYGCIVPPSSSLSKLADRVAAGENLSIFRNIGHHNHQELSGINSLPSLGAEYGRFYRPCPILKNSSSSSQINTNTQQSSSNKQSPPSPSSISPSILDCWDVQQAFIYVFRHHLAGYNEVETRVRASEDSDFLKVLGEDLQQSQRNGNCTKSREIATVSDVLSTFLVFWLGWLTAQDNKPPELTEHLLKLIHQNQITKNNVRKIPVDVYGDKFSLESSSSSLAHHMEFLAGAFDNGDIKILLRKLRKERQQQQHVFENTSQRIGRHILPSIRAITGTTPSHHESPLLKESKFDETLVEKSASALIEVESTVSVKPRSRRLFRFFRKKKRRRDKNKSSNTSTITSARATIGIKQESSPKERPIVSSDDKTESSPSVTGDEKFSASMRSKYKSAASQYTKSPSMILKELSNVALSQSTDSLFGNTLLFLGELELVCVDIEKSLMRSFSQKFARWALQPWTANKESTLANVTNTMRERLRRCNQNDSSMPLLDPIDSSCEPLSSIDTNGCYILPSAHFPLLLTFDCKRSCNQENNIQFNSRGKSKDARNCHMSNNTTSILFGEEYIYRTTVELIALKGSRVVENNEKLLPRGFTIHGSVAGSVVESQQSVGVGQESNNHIWNKANFMVFDSRSTWGAPQTLSLRLSEAIVEPTEKQTKASIDSTRGRVSSQKECGYCWVNLTPYWEQSIDKLVSRHRSKLATKSNAGKVTCKAQVVPFDAFKDFDEHGDLPKIYLPENMELIEIELQITTKILETKSSVRRSLLYKHDDDVRQEMFAIEFIKACDRILRSCGLDMKMLIFRCIPVGKRRGFIEWVQGSVPLSEICQPFAGSILAKSSDMNKKLKSIIIENNTSEAIDEGSDDEDDDDDNITLSSVAKAGMTKYESLSRLRCDGKSSPKQSNAGSNYALPNNNNPIQDFLRSLAYDPNGSFRIKRKVMDTYIKSCAGYSVCTYILGVGDRHLDNLLLHKSGHFFHCDYSFILGNDPKKYLPMRITQDMINGMGGWKSDNFCKFLSLACAAFLTLRRPENVRHLLSLIRFLEGCGLPDLEITQTIETAIQGVRTRLKLDLSDEEAITFMEELIQDSCSSKMWIAVDAIHSLAQKF